VAVIRLAAVAVMFAAERFVDHPAAVSAPFEELTAAAAAYSLLALREALRKGGHIPASLYALVDLAFVLALVYTSGGPFSQLRYALFLVPIIAALLLRPALTAAASAATIAGYTAIALLYPNATAERPDAIGFEITQGLYLALMGAAATLVAWVLARRAEEAAKLSQGRGRLVAQALAAEDNARRRLAEELHDEAIQNLLAARHELAALNGNGGDLTLVHEGIDRTVKQLRDAVFDLHPYLLEHGGLAAALEATAERQGRLGGFAATVEIAPEATGHEHDQLLVSLARELLTNVTKHAGAEHATLTLRRDADGLHLKVTDDGRGLAPGTAPESPEAGHIGLASCNERTEAVGGQLAVESVPGRGTTVRLRLPISGTDQHLPRAEPPGGLGLRA